MEDQIVSFETAKLAKEKGFDWPCDYTKGGDLSVDHYKDYQDDKYTKEDIENAIDNGYPVYLAPTQSLLQKWLREKYNIHIELIIDGWGKDEEVSEEDLCYRAFVWKVGKAKPKEHEDLGASNYETILEIALVVALELVEVS